MTNDFNSTFVSIINPAQGKSSEQVVAELTAEQLNLTDKQGSGLLIRLLAHRNEAANNAAMALIGKLSGEQILRNNDIGTNALNVAIDSGNTEALRAIAAKVGRSRTEQYDHLLQNSPEMRAACNDVTYDPDIVANSTAAATPLHSANVAARTAGS